METLNRHLCDGLSIERYEPPPFTGDLANAINHTQTQHKLRFDCLTFFSRNAMEHLHAPLEYSDDDAIVHLPDTTSVESQIKVLEQLANGNRLRLSKDIRERYLAALLAVCRLNMAAVATRKFDENTCFIGIEREGALLGRWLGLLPAGRSCAPTHKRMPYQFGLLVGACGLPERRNWDEVFIVDGAVATGATTIALLDCLEAKRLTLFSAHSTHQGLNALIRYCKVRGIRFEAYIGFVTDGLDDHYYASVEGKKVVGDLGDWISPLFPTSR